MVLSRRSPAARLNSDLQSPPYFSQNYLVFTAGVGGAAKQPDAAKALIKHLSTPAAAAVIKAKGMEPVAR